MIIAVGSDHNGYPLKLALAEHLRRLGHTVVDVGCDDPSPTDYPIYGERVGRAVASGECGLGVAACGTGVGISLAANRVPGIRAAVCSDPYTAEYARRHNDANVLAFGARVVAPELAAMILDRFLEARFEGGRHLKRVAMLDRIR